MSFKNIGCLAASLLFSYSSFAEVSTTLENLTQRAAVGDHTAQVAIAQYHFTKNEEIEAGAWLYLAYNNNKNEVLMDAFAKKFHGASPETLEKIEQKFIELHKEYGKPHTDAIYKPQLLSDKECDITSKPKPINRRAPKYPATLATQGIIGFTKLNFTISKYGQVRDIEIAKYTNKGFIKESLKALQYWQYTETSKNNFNNAVQLVFHLNGVSVQSDINKFSELIENNSSNVGKTQYELIDQLESNRQFLAKEEITEFTKQYKSLRQIEHSPFQAQEKNFWLTQSAQNGYPQAQFELSVNMANGRGCKVNPVIAEHWLKAATLQNYLPAKALAGNNLLLNDSLDKHRLGISLLKEASKGRAYKTKLDLAWQLSSSKFKELLDPKLALELIEQTSKEYRDNVRILETEAAAYAALGDFEEAVNLQEDAINIAEDLEWLVIPDEMEQRLINYKGKKVVTGSYY